MTEVIRVLQADCDRRFKDEVSEFIQGQEDLYYLGALDSANHILQVIADTRPHLVLLGLDLKPRGGGLGALKVIRERWHEDELAVVIISPPAAGESALQKAADLGANYYIQRPVGAALLARRIKQICSVNSRQVRPEVSREQVQEICREYFDSMGIPPHYKGYRYLMEGVWLAITYPPAG